MTTAVEQVSKWCSMCGHVICAHDKNGICHICVKGEEG